MDFRNRYRCRIKVSNYILLAQMQFLYQVYDNIRLKTFQFTFSKSLAAAPHEHKAWGTINKNVALFFFIADDDATVPSSFLTH